MRNSPAGLAGTGGTGGLYIIGMGQAAAKAATWNGAKIWWWLSVVQELSEVCLREKRQ